MLDYLHRKIPDYYPYMYLDGFTPTEIYIAHQRSLQKQFAEWNKVDKIKIESEIKVK